VRLGGHRTEKRGFSSLVEASLLLVGLRVADYLDGFSFPTLLLQKESRLFPSPLAFEGPVRLFCAGVEEAVFIPFGSWRSPFFSRQVSHPKAPPIQRSERPPPSTPEDAAAWSSFSPITGGFFFSFFSVEGGFTFP